MQASLIVRWALLASVLVAAGCSNWGRRRVDQPTPINPHDPVWIWTRGGVEKWRAVVITHDSVSGIPFEFRECTMCRRSIPRVQVDSMVHGYHTLAEGVTDIVGMAAVVTLGDFVVCYLLDPHDHQC
jgi:hypothetical protein